MPSAEYLSPDPSDEETGEAVEVTQGQNTSDEGNPAALEAAKAWDTSDEAIEEAVEATSAADISGEEIADAVEAIQGPNVSDEEMEEPGQAAQAMQDAENFSPGPGPRTRRRRGPGNLWTLEAREDMFRRREAGEGWETIILVRDPGAIPVHGLHRVAVCKLPKLPFSNSLTLLE